MFEKRPIWGLILGLNVCILIWLISVQEPVMFDANTAAISSSSSSSSSSNSGSSNNFVINSNNNGWGRDLLSKPISAQSNEYADELTVTAATLTTFNFSNSNHKHSNNSNNNNINNNNNYTTAAIKENKLSKTHEHIKTTTKTSDLFADLQSLTSSLGTGVIDLKPKPTPSWSSLSALSSALPAEDFNQLIDLQNFEFLMPQPVCSHHIEALILIHSAPKNYEKRQVIRETWASISHHRPESPLKVLFLLGAVNKTEIQEDLENENNLYRDIIQGSFIDDYRNMTYKHIMAFKWFLYNCPQAQILIKVDDDVYVNTPQLIKYLREQQQNDMQLNKNNIKNKNENEYEYENTKPTIKATTETQTTNSNNNNNNNNANSNNTITTTTTSTLSTFLHKLNIFSSETSISSSSSSSSSPTAFNASHELFNHPQNLLFCQKIIGSLVKRSYRSKWRVSFKEYSERYYPPYCPGYAIIYSPDIIFRLYKAAQKSKYFWIDDVHITGVLAQQTNTTITTSSHYVLYSDECDDILMGKTDLSSTEFLFAWHSISAQKIKLLWHLQMMSIHSLNDLHYKKSIINDVFELKQQGLEQPGNINDNNIISSSYTYTSANGFR